MFIIKTENGYSLLQGDFAKNENGYPVDGNGEALSIETSDAAIEAVYGDLWERAKPGILKAAS